MWIIFKKSGGGEGVFISAVCLLPNKLTLSYYISFSLPDTEITSPAQGRGADSSLPTLFLSLRLPF